MDTVVYEWRREDGTPYYIGIGKPQRPYTGKRNCGPPPSRERIVILHEGLDWEKACEIEKELIAWHGRKDLGTGILRNLTDGGEGTRGLTVSEETKAKISEALSGENHPMYGKTGENHPMHGKKHTEETKAKISEALSGKNSPNYGKRHSEETRAKMSEAQSGENHHMYGKKLSEETKEKISEAQLGEKSHWYGKTHSEETRAKISGKNSPHYTPRNWYHPIHGEVLQKSISELIKMFPKQKLHQGHLSLVANGKRPRHKGWTKVESFTGEG